jgi:hypothetical protein
MFLLASLKAHLILKICSGASKFCFVQEKNEYNDSACFFKSTSYLKIVPAHQNSVPIFLCSHWSIFSRPSRLSEKFSGSWGLSENWSYRNDFLNYKVISKKQAETLLWISLNKKATKNGETVSAHSKSTDMIFRTE